MEKPVAIITGSARRLGRRIAVALAKKNFRVVINYSRSKVQSEHTVREIKSFGGEVFSVYLDALAADRPCQLAGHAQGG